VGSIQNLFDPKRYGCARRDKASSALSTGCE
jgi:hypothetical protein